VIKQREIAKLRPDTGNLEFCSGNSNCKNVAGFWSSAWTIASLALHSSETLAIKHVKNVSSPHRVLSTVDKPVTTAYPGDGNSGWEGGSG
jgi:hypothetical protein